MATGRHYGDAGAATLRGWAALMLHFPGPRLIAAALVTAAAARLAIGGWRAADAVVALSFVAAQPFTEWVLHVVVLHFRPRRLGGRTLDLYAARKHREHHLDPEDIPLTLIQLPVLAAGIPAIVLVELLAFRSAGLALTAATTSLALVLVYEWTHFLIHSPHVPRSRWYRHVWRAHRLHHFKNEHYWFGITVHLADHLLGTFPDRAGVETSPTARTLSA